MKSLKTRNKSPVHYKYTWQRCTNQSYLFAEGFSGSCPVWPPWAVPRRACDPQARTGQQLEGHEHTLPAGQLSVSQRPTGVYQAENMPGIWQTDLCEQIPECTGGLDETYVPGLVCNTEQHGNQQLLLGILVFFNATFQSFLLIWENRCHVCFLLSLVAMTPLDHVLSYVKNISILCCNTQYY